MLFMPALSVCILHYDRKLQNHKSNFRNLEMPWVGILTDKPPALSQLSKICCIGMALQPRQCLSFDPDPQAQLPSLAPDLLPPWAPVWRTGLGDSPSVPLLKAKPCSRKSQEKHWGENPMSVRVSTVDSRSEPIPQCDHQRITLRQR